MTSGEYYNPWNHRTLIHQQNGSSPGDARIIESPLISPLSPNGINFDALVSKLIADEDHDDYGSPPSAIPSINSCSLNHFNTKSNSYQEPNQMATNHHHHHPQFKSSWESKKNFNSRSNGSIQYQDTSRPFNQNGNIVPNKVYENGKSQPNYQQYSFAGGDVNLNRFNPKLSPLQAAPRTQAKQNFKPPGRYINQQQEKELNPIVFPANRTPSARRGYDQPQLRQPQTQMRSIRAAIRNSSLGGVTPGCDINYWVERCYEQFKLFEKERKKVETDLVRLFPGKKISSSNNIPIARPPQNPSRLDRLVVDQLREHAKAITIIAKMEQLTGNNDMPRQIHETIQLWLEAIRNVQQKRKDEILTSRTGMNGMVDDMCEAIYAQISLAAHELCSKTRSARTALWSSYVSLVNDMDIQSYSFPNTMSPP